MTTDFSSLSHCSLTKEVHDELKIFPRILISSINIEEIQIPLCVYSGTHEHTRVNMYA